MEAIKSVEPGARANDGVGNRKREDIVATEVAEFATKCRRSWQSDSDESPKHATNVVVKMNIK